MKTNPTICFHFAKDTGNLALDKASYILKNKQYINREKSYCRLQITFTVLTIHEKGT